MVKALDKVATNGGIISSDPPKQKYQFASDQHISLDHDIQTNLWRFGLSTMARDLLDHMATQHDEQGELHATQKELAAHFGCSQPKVSKALTQLDKMHFAWKVRRGVLQVNPTYAYRWGSRKQRALIARLGAKFFRERTIVIPEAGR
ncbi:replication/maintenance protein RepL [Streptomyces ardesiacus]|uniref:replication/maintenance protein RepL n=1 Tax=Streptomyces ardesiacus TaxID=285564 RepID=UPI0033CA3D66